MSSEIKETPKGSEIADNLTSESYTEENKAEQQAELVAELNGRLADARLELDEHYKIFHQQDADRIVKNHVLTGSAMGLVPFPVIDVFALSTTQLNMVYQLTRHYQLEFDEKKAKALILALIVGSIPVATLVSLSSFAKLLPGIGTLGGNATLVLTGGAVTYATGHCFIKHFNAGGTLEDFHADNYIDYFKEEFQNGKEFILRNKKEEDEPASEAELKAA